jgi:hypothetical protein
MPSRTARTATSAPIGFTHRAMIVPKLIGILDPSVIFVKQWSTIR